MEDPSVVEFEALSADRGGLGASEVAADFRPSDFGRQSDPRIESVIAATWERRLAANPRLFDGSKFRLHRVHRGSKVVLQLGLTSYRDYLGTNCAGAEAADRIRRQGLARGDARAFMADPLGVSALLLSSDRQFVLLRRSQWCGEAQGLVDGPGGHPEPQKVPGIFGGPGAVVDPALVVKEIFDSIVDEVVDEVNVPRSELDEPRLLGIIKNNTTAGRRSVQFLIRCKLSSSEIRESFDLATQSEAYESTAILFRSEAELLTAEPQDYAPQTRGGLNLYFHLKNKEENML